MMKHLRAEARLLTKPGRKDLLKDTFRILGAALLSAAALKLFDTGFSALMGLFF